MVLSVEGSLVRYFGRFIRKTKGGLVLDYTVYAIKGSSDWFDILASLKLGEGRFGWSYVPTADLRQLKTRVENDGWGSLSDDEKACYYSFLLDIKKGDYVVYINIPKYGECTIAKVTGDYEFRYEDEDFNHRFPVDPDTIIIFNRNDDIVHPALSRRFKLQGPWWRIYLKEEFEELLEILKEGSQIAAPTPQGRLSNDIKPFLLNITQKIQHNYPGKKLEDLFEKVFKNVPRVIKADIHSGWGSDHGADLLITFESGLPFPEAEREDTLVVQIKSYKGEHWDTSAVDDIRRAFEHYPEARMGLIISTADTSTPELDNAIDKLRRDSKKEVGLLIGQDVAAFLLRYGTNLLALS